MRSLRLVLLVVLMTSLISNALTFVQAEAQSSNADVKVSVHIPGSNGQQFDGIYLGHGLVLTTWRAATLYSLQNTSMANNCLLYTSPSPRDGLLSRMPSSA